ENRHVRAEAEGDDGCVVADDPAADDDDPARGDPRDPGQQEPTPAERLLEEVRARLRGEAPGDLAHRREERERPLVGLDGLVGDVVAALDELARARRRQRDAVLVGLDLFCDADLHAGAGQRYPADSASVHAFWITP